MAKRISNKTGRTRKTCARSNVRYGWRKRAAIVKRANENMRFMHRDNFAARARVKLTRAVRGVSLFFSRVRQS